MLPLKEILEEIKKNNIHLIVNKYCDINHERFKLSHNTEGFTLCYNEWKVTFEFYSQDITVVKNKLEITFRTYCYVHVFCFVFLEAMNGNMSWDMAYRMMEDILCLE